MKDGYPLVRSPGVYFNFDKVFKEKGNKEGGSKLSKSKQKLKKRK